MCEPWKKHSRANAAAITRELFHHAQPEERKQKAGLYFTKRAQGCLQTIPFLPADKNDPNCVATRGVPDHHFDCVKAVAFERAQEWKRVDLQRGRMSA